MEQFEVIKAVTLVLGRMLQEGVSETIGAKIPVLYEYNPNVRKGKGSLTAIHCGLTTRAGNDEREYERTKQGEQFRARPLLLRSRYLVSAWASPPDDQALLGAVLRTFHDQSELSFASMEEEQIVAYAGTPTVSLESVSLSEHKMLADSYGMPLAPSVTYSVEFRLQSGKVTPIKRVIERVTDFRKIDG